MKSHVGTAPTVAVELRVHTLSRPRVLTVSSSTRPWKPRGLQTALFSLRLSRQSVSGAREPAAVVTGLHRHAGPVLCTLDRGAAACRGSGPERGSRFRSKTLTQFSLCCTSVTRRHLERKRTSCLGAVHGQHWTVLLGVGPSTLPAAGRPWGELGGALPRPLLGFAPGCPHHLQGGQTRLGAGVGMPFHVYVGVSGRWWSSRFSSREESGP